MIMRLSIATALLIVAATTLSSCSPFYVLRAAYVESGILLRRQSIDKVVADPETTDEERGKLQLVLDARAFAISLGLTPGQSYTKYTRVDSDILAWVLMASREDAFEMKTWWFPIVGSVPYKGYFEKEDAEREGARLAKKGYEFFVRGTDAFSTLGWFNDPVLSTILKNPDVRIVNTIIHESLHATVWIPNHVEFNESLANFVGLAGALDFYRAREAACRPNCSVVAANDILIAEQEMKREFEFAQFIRGLYFELEALYASEASREEKVRRRVEIFERHIAPLREHYPNMRSFQRINNAEIMQVRIYLSHLEHFRDLFTKVGGNWTLFLKEIEKIKEILKDRDDADPFDILKERIAAGPVESLVGEVTAS